MLASNMLSNYQERHKQVTYYFLRVYFIMRLYKSLN